MLSLLGVSFDCTKIIHVAGTNGKGSVCRFISNTLTVSGYKTGLFVSPHLVTTTERMQINGKNIEEDAFAGYFEKMYGISLQMVKDGYKHPAYFEFLFGLALLYFTDEKVDYLVLETGLGGLLDCTNLVEAPVLTVITSISLDHMNLLGDSIEAIAYHKAGIIKAGIPVVYWGEDKRVDAIIKERAKEFSSPAICVSKKDIIGVVRRDKSIDFSIDNGYYDNVNFCVPTTALYQTENATLAATALAVLGEDSVKACVSKGLSSFFWEGRMEEVLTDVYVDGAHNEDGIRAFTDTVELDMHPKKLLMFSVVSDKDYESMVAKLTSSACFDSYVLCTVAYKKRATSVSELKEVFGKYTKAPLYVEENVEAAVDRILALKGDASDTSAYITGSLYLVGEVKNYISHKFGSL